MLFSVQSLKQVKIIYHKFIVLNFAKLLKESLKGGDFDTSASRSLAFYSTARTLPCLRLRLVLLLKTVPHIAQCFLVQFESDYLICIQSDDGNPLTTGKRDANLQHYCLF